MPDTVQAIPLTNLLFALLPAGVVLAILYRWSAGGPTTLYAVGRMCLQLALVGYVLTFLFGSGSSAVVLITLGVMVLTASWIALRPVVAARPSLYSKALLAIGLGGLCSLVVITQGVLATRPWHNATILIPLGGMIFAAAMNAVSLSAERFHAEQLRGAPYHDARRAAMQAALIPQVNTLFAVGLVSLPGMMTGQILSGVPPLIAARYQIMVMCMLFGSAGISAAFFLFFQKQQSRVTLPEHPLR